MALFQKLVLWGLPALLAAAVLIVPNGRAAEVGFAEDFALAKDRATALRQLIPGTEDYYYYHALHLLNTEQYAKAEELTRPWHERFGQTARLNEIQVRHALLAYEKDPPRALAYLRNRLDLHFDHQKEIVGAAPNLPTTLDPRLIARDTLTARAFGYAPNLDHFEEAALDRIAAGPLSREHRRALLQRLRRPDVPNLPQLVADDLKAEHAPEFGAYPVHAMMPVPQLEELLKLKPDLLNANGFVRAWVAKLRPGDDADLRHDRAVARAYLDRLEAFVARLAPAHNALKAHVLFHRLALDRAGGTYDKDRFLRYLALPRRQGYMAKALLESARSQTDPADLNADYGDLTPFPPVRADEDLVRDYLKHFLAAAPSPKEFEPYIDDTYLKHLFAEVKVENGLGDPETWAAQLPPELFARLKERVDIDFAHTNKVDFATDEPVRLDLFVKNVPTLLVKVFEVNTVNFYRSQLREVDTDINLDGLVPNAELSHPYAEPPLRRIARKFEFPQLTKPGVYVIDFIGAGKSSRALVRKGRLKPVVSTGPAGQTVTVVDEANKPVPNAAVWLGGREYPADKDGTAVVPFTAQPGPRPVVLRRGDFASLDHISHEPEQYQLAAGIHVERESLLTQRVAAVLVRPGLTLAGRPVSVKLLHDVRLRITSTDHAGVLSSTEVDDFKLYEDRESVYEFRVPPRLARLTVALAAKVKSLSLNEDVGLSAEESFSLNAIDTTDKTEDLHFAEFGGGYVVELLGRSGEAKPDRAVHFAFKHHEFRDPVSVTLKTDNRGRVTLGPLADIDTVTATGPEGVSHTWPLPTDHHTYRDTLHARAGEVVTVPYLGSAGKATREELAFFELRGGAIAADRFDALAVADALIELRGLAPGDYELWLKRTGQRIRVRVTDGPVVRGYALGATRHLELPRLKPVQIAAATLDDKELVVRLKDAAAVTRVHVLGTRYDPEFSAFGDLSKVRDAGLRGVRPTRPESVYLTGRNIGDEYRYVLDRRATRKYPGNMLDRPPLLLNPWAVRSTDTGEQLAQAGDEFGRKGAARPSEGLPPASPAPKPGAAPGGANFADLDFLADPAAVLTNLVPDKDGVVRVPRQLLAGHALVRVVAVDPQNTTTRTVSLPEPPARFVDLRLRDGLDANGHFTQQKQVSVLTPGQPFTLADAAGSRFEAYDSLGRVYGLYTTLSKDPRLTEFAFLPTWPKLKPEEKRAAYSKHASHELNFFLYKKDPEFFAAVVKPYLANKKDKTFLDHYLLGDDLTAFLDPWRYGRLNAVERILLGQRLAGEGPKAARHLSDLAKLMPPGNDQVLLAFNVAVEGGALSVDGSFGLGKLKSSAADRQQLYFDPAKPMGGLGGGGFGGGGFGGGGGQGMAGAGGRGGPGNAPQGGAMGAPGASTSPAPEAVERLSEADKKADMAKREATDRAAGARKMAKDQAEKQLRRRDEKAKEQPFFDAPTDAERFGVARQFYRRLDPTMEWAENNYHHRRIFEQVAGLVTVSPFWLDYARHDGKGPFLSRHLAEPTRNFPEMAFALAVLDLPFEPGKHDVKFDQGKMSLTPGSSVVAFHEEVRPAAAPNGKVPVLVGENFYRHGDRFREENGEKVDKFVTGEFLVQTVYGCQVVVTNPTSSRQRLTVLVQLPVGAIPVANGQFTRSVPLDLEPYRTQTVDTLFYFPKAGRFPHFPAHVAKDEQVVAAAKPATLDVVEKLSKPDTASWDYVSQNGTEDDVLGMLARENVFALNLDKIAWRMRDRAFFEKVIALLKDRHAYNPTLWSYALLHNDPATAKEFLSHADSLVAEAGGPIDTPLLTIDPVARHQYEHLEYKPLVNARAHALGARRQIVNPAVHEQYHKLLKQLSYRPALDDTDLLAVVYYLLVQDRVEEAEAAFARVNPGKVATKLQYDYCAAYLAMYDADAEKARAIAGRHVNHPVDRWRNTFTQVVHQIDEATGKGPRVADADDRGQRQGQLAATEPGFEANLNGAAVNLTWQNLDAVTVNYYLMDVELLFSRTPFAQQAAGQFAFTKPNATKVVKLPAGEAKLTVPLPAELVKKNVLVEVSAAGQTRAVPYYAGSMDVKTTEAYGQVKVADGAGGPPLPRVYVKVYARLADGRVKFHKDGYTDLRGRFDYATVSTPESSPVQRFSVLVLSDDRGAAIREVNPPQQ